MAARSSAGNRGREERNAASLHSTPGAPLGRARLDVDWFGLDWGAHDLAHGDLSRHLHPARAGSRDWNHILLLLPRCELGNWIKANFIANNLDFALRLNLRGV